MTSMLNLLDRDRTPFILGIVALGIYLPGIWWGLPHATHPLGTHGWDVDSVTGLQTLSELHNLFLENKADWWVAYPLFHYLVVGLAYAPYLAYLILSHGLKSSSAEFPYGLADPLGTLANLALIGRLVTTLMASGVVVATYLIGRTAWDKRTGVVAAVAMMLATPMFYYARTGNLDVPVLFWTSLGLLVVARSCATGFTIGRAVQLGAFAALSVATKDQAYGAWLGGLLLMVIVHYRQEIASTILPRTDRWKAPLAMLLSGGVVYGVASGLAINPSRFFAHIWFLVYFKQTFPNVVQSDILRPVTPMGYLLLTSDVLQALVLAIGPALLLLGLMGLVITWRSSLFTRVLLAMALTHILLVIWPIRHMQYRYSLFLVLVLAVLSAPVLSMGLRGQPVKKAITIFAAIASFIWLGARGMDLTYQMLFDSRIAAGNWLAQHGQPSDEIVFFGPTPNTVPPLPAGMSSRGLPEDATALEILKRERVRYVLAIPGFFSDVGLERNRFVPEVVRQHLEDGTLGYRKLAVFETRPLFEGPLADFPLASLGYLVNPTVQIFGLTADEPPQSVKNAP